MKPSHAFVLFAAFAMPVTAQDSAPGKKIEAAVEEAAAAGEFSGAVMVVREGEVVFQGAYGLASRSFQAPNRVDTKFNLGSMNKMFTAVAVAQLAQQRKLSFDDLVGKHLPDWPNREVREKVRIDHLLTHTSGMGSYFNEKYQKAAKEQFRLVRGLCMRRSPRSSSRGRSGRTATRDSCSWERSSRPCRAGTTSTSSART